MGTLTYGGTRIGFEDRLLEHLHIVIVQQLKRGESFAVSWKDSAEIGDGRSSIWLHPGCNLYFKFFGGRSPQISTDWLHLLTDSARSSRGLIVVNEDGSLARAEGKTHAG